MEISTDSGFYRIVLVTCPSHEEAKNIALATIENKLAACVNIIPQVQSIYRWEGKIQQDEEYLLLIKTQTSKVQALADHIGNLHSYTVPECIVLPIESGSASYLSWLRENTP